MERWIAEIRAALAGGPHRPYPESPAAAGPVSGPAAVERLAAAVERAGGIFARCSDEDAARDWIASRYPDRDVVLLGSQEDPGPISETAVGVDRADLVLADTGTVVRHYPTREASRISLVPEVSVFLADRGRIVAGYEAAFESLAPLHRVGRAYTVFVTGPSRTADIEKELVIPAHGPRELVVILVG